MSRKTLALVLALAVNFGCAVELAHHIPWWIALVAYFTIGWFADDMLDSALPRRRVAAMDVEAIRRDR